MECRQRQDNENFEMIILIEASFFVHVLFKPAINVDFYTQKTQTMISYTKPKFIAKLFHETSYVNCSENIESAPKVGESCYSIIVLFRCS